MQPQFQSSIQQQPMHQHQYQYQPPFAPQGPMQGQMGQPRAPLGAPQRHQWEVVWGIEAHFRPIITNNPSPVVIPHRADGRTFEVRTTALQSLPKFKGLATEEPYFHLETYDSICNTIGGQGFSSDDVKGLRSFQQQSGEMFHEAFERFNMMLRNCPHHGIQLWELLNAFHEGLSSEDARDLMSITNGIFGTNYEHIDWAFLEQMAVNSKRKAQSSRRARHVTQRPQVHGVESDNVQTTNQVYNVCTNCNEIGHTTEVCVVGVVDEQVEEVNAIQGGGGRNFNMNSNTYHPGLRNHPNFRYGNAANQANPNFQGAQGNFAPRQQYNQGNYRGGNNYGYQGQFQQTGQGGLGQSSSSGSLVMDMLRAMQQDMKKRNQLDEVRMQKDEVCDKSIQSLTTQMGQLATDVAELKKNKGQLPSDTKGVVEDVTGNESDDEVSPVKPKESNVNKPGLGENEKSEKVEGEPSQVPFPSALLDPGKKNFIASRGPQKEELWDMFKQVKINLPLLDAIKQVPAYAKFLKELCTQKRQQKKKMPKRVDLTRQVSAVLNGELPPKLKDLDMPLINIQVGNFQMAKALLDLGAGLPRGMVQNVIVKIDEFYYPVDFLVLDYSSADPKQQQNVILGRPFFSTAHAVIDCRFGTVDMTFGNRKMRLNIFTNNSDAVGVDECFMADLVDGCNPHEYEEDGIDICLCDFSEQVHACALGVEEENQDAMALKEGRPPWTHQFKSLPVETNSGTRPSLEEPPRLELKDLPSHLKKMVRTKERAGASSYSSSKGKGKQPEVQPKKRQYLGSVSESESEDEEIVELDPANKPK
ncbi:uncharacterized protein LOC110932135 [Helianthus annuus]|uniref:uncharacterized protein LOC110932135 n=1 Tax=Helianthus annuus TaxID=4232 RepID=UPI000B900C28|nr:uncharacterized protein LOC110932135 [Helianthus annuus]